MRGGVGSSRVGGPGPVGAPWWPSLAVVALVIGLGTVGFVAVGDRAAAQHEAEAESAAARTALELRAALTELLVAVDTGTDHPAVTEVQLAADGSAEDDAEHGAVLASDEAAIAMARARDTAGMVVSAPVGDDGTVVLVQASYAATDGAEPVAVADRRAALTGYTVGIVEVPELIPDDVAGTRQITDGVTVLAGFAERPASVAESDVSVVDRRWVVAAPVTPATPGVRWVIAVLTGLACAAVVGGSWWWWRRERSRAEEAVRVRERADAVVTYAGVVQDSHDLGQVVPAIAVQVADRLELAGLSLSIATDLGRQREVFTYGEEPDLEAAPTATLPDSIPAGATVALHLRRAERSIGVLRFRCGRDIGSADLDQLRIAAELITSTVVTSRALEQQQDAVERLRVLDDLKNTFLGTASHELRTPVTAISGFSFMLSERWDRLSEDDRRTFADRIASNARALEALVQDLLDFARMERGDVELVLEAVDVAAAVGRVLDRLEPVWSSHVIERDLRPADPVTADVGALERIVTNLVSNAVKFSPAGSPVRVAVASDDGGVRLTVDDEGPGVPVEERERIFVRFFRGRGESVLRTGGVGIGLAVVKDFVDQMGGTIAVSESPGGGARFSVHLPVHGPAIEREVQGAAST